MRRLLLLTLILLLSLGALAQTVRIQGQELSYRLVAGRQMVSRAQLAKAFPGFPDGQGEVDLAELVKDPNARVMKRDGLIVSVRFYDKAMAAFYEASKEPPPRAEVKAAAGAAQASPAGAERALLDEIVRLSNIERQANGVPPVTADPLLEKSAAGHSQEMATLGYFAHESPTPGRETPHDRILLAGAHPRKSGENLAKFRGTPEATLAQDAVTGWMNSPGHRANLLDGGFTHIGIGVARGADGSVYITQNFCAY